MWEGKIQGQKSQVGEKWKMALGMKESLTVLGNTKTGPRSPICRDQAAKDEAGRAGRQPDRHY